MMSLLRSVFFLLIGPYEQPSDWLTNEPMKTRKRNGLKLVGLKLCEIHLIQIGKKNYLLIIISKNVR